MSIHRAAFRSTPRSRCASWMTTNGSRSWCMPATTLTRTVVVAAPTVSGCWPATRVCVMLCRRLWRRGRSTRSTSAWRWTRPPYPKTATCRATRRTRTLRTGSSGRSRWICTRRRFCPTASRCGWTSRATTTTMASLMCAFRSPPSRGVRWRRRRTRAACSWSTPPGNVTTRRWRPTTTTRTTSPPTRGACSGTSR